MNDQNVRNLTQQLVHDLGSAIVKGVYTSAEGLPSEAELCEQFSVSRSATREAVKMLTAKGMLSSRPRQGIRVQPREQWNLFDTEVLQWILTGAPTLSLLRDFLQLRSGIEPQAAYLAARTSDAKKIKDIELALENMKQAEQGHFDLLDADISFHIAILSATNNLFFIQLRSFIATALRVSIRFTNRIKGLPGDYEKHETIYSSIADGDCDTARRLTQEILGEALMLIDSQIDKQIDKQSD
ncbi:MAG: FadR family transcriptional regulator [Cellvibrionaceae bacterium]|nr:FadR family transcriptional regulator [Cellvibrionaceae bacterium]